VEGDAFAMAMEGLDRGFELKSGAYCERDETLFLGLESDEMGRERWAGLRARLSTLPPGKAAPSLFPAAPAFFLCTAEGKTGTSEILGRLEKPPSFRFSSFSCVLMRIETAEPLERRWQEVHWEIEVSWRMRKPLPL
jgi:hypothetical protein